MVGKGGRRCGDAGARTVPGIGPGRLFHWQANAYIGLRF